MPNHLENARLIAILGKYAKVRKEGSAAELINIVNRYDDALDEADHDTRVWANTQKQAIDAGVKADAFRLFAEKVDALSEFKDIFKLGAKMAEDGEEALIFPSAAASLGKIAGLLQELKDAADTIKAKVAAIGGNIRDVVGAVEARDLIALIEELEAVKKNTDSVKDTLVGFKDEIENS